MKDFNGKILFLDRADINTDEIIPARYLTEVSKAALKPHLFEDLELSGFNPGADIVDKAAVVSRANFGCGSSREHAPWALETNGIHLVIAESFARIFRQNMFNGGMLAIALDADHIDFLFNGFAETETRVKTDFENAQLTFSNSRKSETIPFSISDFDRQLVAAGGWVDFADRRYE